MSFFDLGGATAGYYKTMLDGYNAKRDFDQRQQQVDFVAPKELSMNPMMLQGLSSNPLYQMRNAYMIGQGVAPEPPPREFFDFRSGTPKQVAPQGGFNEYAPQSPEAPYLPDETRRPAGDFSIKGTPSMTPKAKGILEDALRPFQDGTAAAALGLKQDPDSGRVYGPGRQVKEYYDMLERASQNQAAIMAAGVRPQAQAPATVVMPERSYGGGKGKDPRDVEIDRLDKQNKGLDRAIADIMKNAGIKAGAKGFDPSYLSPDLRERYMQAKAQKDLIQKRLNVLQGLGVESTYTAPQVPGAAPPAPPPIVSSPKFKAKVKEVMKSKGVNEAQATQMLLKALGK